MRRQNRTICGNIACLVLGLVLFVPAAVFPADLKYIRIGEHKDFTRVVFEFRGPVTYKLPEIKGEGVLSVVFLDTKTSLPTRLDSETAKWVDTIEFMPQQTDLVAKLTLAFRYYSVKAFSMTNPERVVFDIKETSEPQKVAVVEEPVKKDEEISEPAQTPVREDEPSPVQEPAPVITPPETVVTQQPVTPPEVSQQSSPKVSPEALLPNVDQRQEGAPPQSSTSPVEPVVSEPPQQTERPIQETALKIEEQPEMEKVTVPTEGPASEQGEVRWPFLKVAQMEGYLLITLVSLSAVIVGLLIYIALRKKRRTDRVTEAEEPNDTEASDSYFGIDESGDEDMAEEGGDVDESIATIDAKIREALKKIK